MPFRNTKQSWGSVSKALHWLIVLLILNQWVIAQRADALTGFQKFTALNWHKWFGMTILMLALIRLAWRLMNPVPDITRDTRPWERLLARLSHFLLYLLVFAMPVSGWLMSSAKAYGVSWFNLFQFPDLVGRDERLYELMHDLHGILFGTLCVVAALHVAGALKHHFIDRNDVLRRMLPFVRVRGGHD